MRKSIERAVKGFSWVCGVVFLFVVSVIVFYLFYKGYGSLSKTLIFGDTPVLDALLLRRQVLDGLFPAVAGTMILVVLSIALAIPAGMAAGIYMAEYAQGAQKKALGLFFDILAGVPSIVIGLFGFAVAIFLHRTFFSELYPSLIVSGFSLAVLVLPYIIRSTEYALESLPAEIKIIAPALGATKLQNIAYVLLPRSSAGIAGGVILAIGRCAEDTAVIMLTGVVAFAGIPVSLLAHYEALPFYIYYISSQYANPEELSTGYGASLILLLICAILFFVSSMIQKGVEYRALYRP
jgi:phosphate transport system permease protein